MHEKIIHIWIGTLVFNVLGCKITWCVDLFLYYYNIKTSSTTATKQQIQNGTWNACTEMISNNNFGIRNRKRDVYGFHI